MNRTRETRPANGIPPTFFAEKLDAAVAPDQIERDGEDGEAQVLAEQRHHVGRHVQRAGHRQQQVERRHQDGEAGEHRQEDVAAAAHTDDE